MPFVITSHCINVKDKSCVKVCPVDCIYEFANEPMLFIHPDECIECGACEPVCPVNAIFPDSEVPAAEQKYITINAAKFEHPETVHVTP